MVISLVTDFVKDVHAVFVMVLSAMIHILLAEKMNMKQGHFYHHWLAGIKVGWYSFPAGLMISFRGKQE